MYTALQDIKIETIDFKWIEETVKISHLKRAIRLIEADGDYYQELKQACYQRIQQLDPSQKRVEINNIVTPQVKQSIENELKEWEIGLEKKKTGKKIFQSNLEDYESYFDNDNPIEKESKRGQHAEKERTKGNEALKSKDYEEAIQYYSKSIEYEPKMYQSFGNRALAYLRKKQYNKCVQDCEAAISINKVYTKAYHRKAKALIALKHKVAAYRCLQDAIRIEPDNPEITKEMKELREEMAEGQIQQLESSLIPKSEFKKITIEEDSEEEEIDG